MRVGDLIGLRVLDDNDVTIGIVRHVARTTEGKVLLIVAHTGPLGWGGRLVSVPIEAVAIFGRQLASLDMKPAEYASAATWTAGSTELLGIEEKIVIGLMAVLFLTTVVLLRVAGLLIGAFFDLVLPLAFFFVAIYSLVS